MGPRMPLAIAAAAALSARSRYDTAGIRAWESACVRQACRGLAYARLLAALVCESALHRCGGIRQLTSFLLVPYANARSPAKERCKMYRAVSAAIAEPRARL